MSNETSIIPDHKKFAVVHFVQDKRYSVVPRSWITANQTHCHWPGKKTRTPGSLIKDENSTPDSSFVLFEINYVKYYSK